MLDKLNIFSKEVEKTGIECLSYYLDENGDCEVVYKNTPTETEIQQINVIKQNMPLLISKNEKLAKIDEEWNQTIAQGWDSGQGVLGISANDVALLSANFSMAKEASVLGYPIPPIITLDDQEISFPDIQSMTIFMLQYGEYRSVISKSFAAKRRAVQAATTIEEVEAA